MYFHDTWTSLGLTNTKIRSRVPYRQLKMWNLSCGRVSVYGRLVAFLSRHSLVTLKTRFESLEECNASSLFLVFSTMTLLEYCLELCKCFHTLKNKWTGEWGRERKGVEFNAPLNSIVIEWLFYFSEYCTNCVSQWVVFIPLCTLMLLYHSMSCGRKVRIFFLKHLLQQYPFGGRQIIFVPTIWSLIMFFKNFRGQWSV